MEINKDYLMRTNRGYLFRVCYNKGVNYQHLPFLEIQRQVGSLTVKKKNGDIFRYALIGVC